jgi:hypothetical protein
VRELIRKSSSSSSVVPLQTLIEMGRKKKERIYKVWGASGLLYFIMNLMCRSISSSSSFVRSISQCFPPAAQQTSMAVVGISVFIF